MKKVIIIILVLSVFSCKNEKQVSKKFYSDSLVRIDSIYSKAKNEFQKGNPKLGMSYMKDSVKNEIVNSYIRNYEFIAYNDKKFRTESSKKPLFLQVTASWCPPCKAEVPALNKVVEKYSDKVDFVLLFWDLKDKVTELANDYNPNIYLIPSSKRDEGDSSIDISNFKHKLGYPFTFLIDSEKKIINLTSGGYVADSTRTVNEAFKLNYEKLDKEVSDLISSKME